MTYGWHKALIASLILLLAIGGVLFLRLDPNKLSISVQAQLQQWSGQKIRIGSVSLSLLHGTSLLIQDVDIQSEKQVWHLHTDSIRLGLSIWHLLRGETSITSAEFIHPVLDFTKPPPVENFTMTNLPEPLSRILIRQGSIRIAGKPVAHRFDGTVQQINGEQELTWELQTSLADGDLATQGRIQYDAQGHGTVFGKLDAERIHVKDLSGFIPTINIIQPAYDTFKTSLTFDVNPDHEWHLFGDARLGSNSKRVADIIWRGKIHGAGWQQLNWQDSFLQLSQNTMLSTVGACVYGRGCHFGIDTKDANISPFLKILNLDYPLVGKFDVKSSCSWQNGQWSIAAQLKSYHVSWSNIAMPDANISIPNSLYHAPEGLHMANVHIQTGNANGSILVKNFIKLGKTWSLDAHASNESRAWMPLANVLLQSHAIKAKLQGKGTINADIAIVHAATHTGLDVSFHANQLQVAYGKVFTKPASIPINMRVHVDMKGDKILLNIAHATLGNSHVKQVQWVIEHRKLESIAAQDIHMNLTRLRQRGIVFPDVMKDWHGIIHGHFSHVHPSRGINVSDWFSKANAKLQLAGFGIGQQRWDGVINIQQGTLSTHNLAWKNANQYAHLTGVINLISRQGSLNLQDAELTWKQGDTLPAWITHSKLHGYLRHIGVDWMGTKWRELYGSYHTRGNHIMLKKIRAKLAGGSARSPKLSLILTPESVHFSGSMYMAIIRLNKLSGLSEALGADLDGYMYLNARLEGDIPRQAKSGWQGNGDIEIQHGHWLPNDKQLAITAGNLHTKSGKMTSFSRFSMRFHLRHSALHFTHMQLESGTTQIIGNGVVYANGSLGGKLQIRDVHGNRQSELMGNWLGLGRFFEYK